MKPEIVRNDLKWIIRNGLEHRLEINGRTLICSCTSKKLELVFSQYGTTDDYRTTAIIPDNELGSVPKTDTRCRLDGEPLKVLSVEHAEPSFRLDLGPVYKA